MRGIVSCIYHSTPAIARCADADNAAGRIKDFLRRLFMNFFQKERIHRARIARKVRIPPITGRTRHYI